VQDHRHKLEKRSWQKENPCSMTEPHDQQETASRRKILARKPAEIGGRNATRRARAPTVALARGQKQEPWRLTGALGAPGARERSCSREPSGDSQSPQAVIRPGRETEMADLQAEEKRSGENENLSEKIYISTRDPVGTPSCVRKSLSGKRNPARKAVFACGNRLGRVKNI
jgi:hypothetical protein